MPAVDPGLRAGCGTGNKGSASSWDPPPLAPALTFGRGQACTIRLPAGDRGLSRSAGSLDYQDGAWWLCNTSSSSMLYLSGDRGFRVDLPPGMRTPVQQWHAKVRLQGVMDSYLLRLRLPDLDDLPDPGGEPGQAERAPRAPATSGTGEQQLTSSRRRAPLTGSDRLILAARFEQYLSCRHVGPAAPRSAKETADRIGWQPHALTFCPRWPTVAVIRGWACAADRDA